MAAISALLALNTPAASRYCCLMLFPHSLTLWHTVQGGQPHPQTDLQNWLTRNDRWDELQWEFKMSGSGSNHSWVVTCDREYYITYSISYLDLAKSFLQSKKEPLLEPVLRGLLLRT